MIIFFKEPGVLQKDEEDAGRNLPRGNGTLINKNNTLLYFLVFFLCEIGGGSFLRRSIHGEPVDVSLHAPSVVSPERTLDQRSVPARPRPRGRVPAPRFGKGTVGAVQQVSGRQRGADASGELIRL